MRCACVKVEVHPLKNAFTMDDLPLWRMSNPPDGYSAEGIVPAFRAVLAKHGVSGGHAFSNSWPLKDNPEFADILDDWGADGHHVEVPPCASAIA